MANKDRPTLATYLTRFEGEAHLPGTRFRLREVYRIPQGGANGFRFDLLTFDEAMQRALEWGCAGWLQGRAHIEVIEDTPDSQEIVRLCVLK